MAPPCAGIALEIWQECLAYFWRPKLSRQARRNGANNLTRRDGATSRHQPEISRKSLDPLHGAAHAQHATKASVMADKPSPKPAHPAARSGQAGTSDRDPERRID